MNEVYRALAVLLSIAQRDPLEPITEDELLELEALGQLFLERGRASVDYHKGTRGLAAIERARADQPA